MAKIRPTILGTASVEVTSPGGWVRVHCSRFRVHGEEKSEIAAVLGLPSFLLSAERRVLSANSQFTQIRNAKSEIRNPRRPRSPVLKAKCREWRVEC